MSVMIGPLVSLVLLCALVAAILTFRRAGMKTLPPECARCGYAVVGLPSSICPECGSDLNDVGIITDRRRNRNAYLIYGGAWTCGLLLMVIIGGALHPPWMTVQKIKRPVLGAIVVHPASAAYKLRIEYSAGIGFDITCTAERRSTLWLDLPTLAFDYCDASGDLKVGDASLTESDLAAWFESSGVNIEKAGVELEVQDLVTFLRAVADGDAFSGNHAALRHFRSEIPLTERSIATPHLYSYTWAIGWLLLWVVGGLLLLRNLRRRCHVRHG